MTQQWFEKLAVHNDQILSICISQMGILEWIFKSYMKDKGASFRKNVGRNFLDKFLYRKRFLEIPNVVLFFPRILELVIYTKISKYLL